MMENSKERRAASARRQPTRRPPALTTLASPLIALTAGLFRREVLGCAAHSPGQTDKSVEDVLGNLNLSSNVTPQMMNLGLSQERESASAY